MKEISSKDNRIFKQAASLQDRKHRDALGMYLIEGPSFIRDAVRYGGRLRFIFIRAGSAEELADLEDPGSKDGPAVYSLTDELFSKLSSTEHSRGAVAAAEKRVLSEESFFALCAEGRGNILVLDRIQDPGNLGTMIRTAEAMGFSGVMLIKGCTDPYAPKTVRACAGSILRMPLFFAEGPEEAVRMLKARGKRLYAARMDGETACMDADLRENAAVIIGNEGSGVSDELSEASEGLMIPMAGSIESLNAGLAAGMIMYESLRQALGAENKQRI